MIIISYILTAVLCIISGIAASGIIKAFHIKTAKKFKDISRLLILTSVITAVVFMIIEFIINKFTVSDGNALVVVALLVEILECLFITVWNADGKLKQLFRRVFFIAVALALCEVFIFNLKSFTSDPQAMRYDLSEINVVNGEGVFEDEKIVMNANCTLSIADAPSWTRGIVIENSQLYEAGTSPFEVAVAIKDGNQKLSFETVQDKLSMGNSDFPLTLSINPYKELYELELRYTRVYRTIEITSISLCSALPFCFSWLRYLILFVIFAGIAVIRNFSLHKVTYNSGKMSHRLAVQIVAVLCTLSSFMFLYTGELFYEYNPEVTYNGDPFASTLDAFIKDTTYLNIDAEPALSELENVYDRSIRDDSGLFYHWDLAYYEGHYYCYFGVAPVILFYYPFYLISGNVPRLELSSFFFGALAILFFCQLFIKMIDHFVKKANLLLMMLMMPATLSCMGVYYSMDIANKYNLPVVTALCFMFLCLWTGICACTAKNKIIRLLLFFVSGVSVVSCVASRPTIALGALVIAPLYIEVLADKSSPIKYRIIQASTFLVPVFIGALMIMMYNKARFGSMLDFGQTYQLTVSDINSNKPSFAGLFPMIYHYFLQLPRACSVFPFFETSFYVLYNYSKYTYLEGCTGALAYPLIVAGLLAVPCVCKYNKSETKSMYLTRKYFVIMCILLAVFIGWQDFCMGGAIIRYVIDILPLLIMGGAVALMYYTRSENNSSTKMKLIILAMAVTFVMAWLITIGITDGKLMNRCPHLYEVLEDILIFWQ